MELSVNKVSQILKYIIVFIASCLRGDSALCTPRCIAPFFICTRCLDTLPLSLPFLEHATFPFSFQLPPFIFQLRSPSNSNKNDTDKVNKHNQTLSEPLMIEWRSSARSRWGASVDAGFLAALGCRLPGSGVRAAGLSEVFCQGMGDRSEAAASGLSGSAASGGRASGHLHVFHQIDLFIYMRSRVPSPCLNLLLFIIVVFYITITFRF